MLFFSLWRNGGGFTSYQQGFDHLESQNATSVTSPLGQRYLSQASSGTHVLLLVRETKTAEWGGTRPYTCLGPATYLELSGSKPISITYRLRPPMPVDVYRSAAVTA